ncbi:NupC/NupG family nucleoside CNT transporter [Ferrimonas balearica]|uniref:NupC/NupG family nucleoside CNT transporter n=1 Tax=Ferrimonas balearica TaxID=44012 RepID=UPI001F3216AC|nr:nucleoside transporter C-terminal domain-containing protein [Ferrimonas balearica]MBY6018711.1 NupC/NupG family nucleoside CNT transporter [Halomonas denitrificans]MBY6095911.1 NupC/NupG family nucleoside CNT transporter [Ferrimonas balearica]
MFQSLLGVIALLAVGYACSENRKAISWRPVIGAFAIILGIAGFVLATDTGGQVLLSVSSTVGQVFGYGAEGIKFAFGSLVDFSVEGIGFVWALQVLPQIIFTASLTSLLYYLGIMQWFVRIIGGGLQKVLGTSRAESMNSAGNIVLGQTEAPLLVKPYHPVLTRSQIFAVMVGGVSSIAGSILAGLAGMGVDLNYLIMACFMSAPAGLMFAKLILPETEPTIDEVPELPDDEKPTSFIDAISKGAIMGMGIAAIVGAVIIACIGLMAMLNGGLGAIGAKIGYEQLSVDVILGALFYPVAWLIGISADEAMMAGSFLGQKIAMNEFVAFASMNNVELSARSTAIMTIALCGFANIGSVAMVVGALSKMIPERSGLIAQLGMKVLLAATLANLMNAAIVGLFV